MVHIFAFISGSAMAADIYQSEPVEITEHIDLNMKITNNNNGITYDSANMDIDAICSDVAGKICWK